VPPPSELLQGMLDPLILKSLAVHRMGISRPIAQVANKTFEVNPGSSVSRPPRDGWLTCFWGGPETTVSPNFIV